MERIENTEGARQADKEAAELDKLDQRRREKQAEELKAKADNVVYFRHFKGGAVSAMSPELAEKMMRKGKGRIITKPPAVDIDQLLNEEESK
jgi:hypothetical protein